MDLGIKTYISISGLILFLSSLASASEVLYAPAFCEPSSLNLTITNKTASVQRVWTQLHLAEDMREESFDLAPHAQIKVNGSQFLNERSGFSVKTWERNSLQISALCDDTESLPLTGTTSPAVSHWLPTSTKTVKIHLLNLFLKSNVVTLSAFNRAGVRLEERQITLNNYYDTETLKWTLSEPVGRIELEGQERLHSWVLYDSEGKEKGTPSLALKPVSLSADPNKTYFLVSTKEARPEESFVIALSDPQQINTAREQVKNKSLEKIVVAGIELGHGGFNRAFSTKDKSPYSWSVSRVDAFADFAHIDCDGSPDLTEERLMQKLNEGGRICFWRYRVVRELSASEVSSGVLGKP